MVLVQKVELVSPWWLDKRVQGGHGIPDRDDIMGPTRVFIWDPCPCALSQMLTISHIGTRILDSGSKAQSDGITEFGLWGISGILDS